MFHVFAWQEHTIARLLVNVDANSGNSMIIVLQEREKFTCNQDC